MKGTIPLLLVLHVALLTVYTNAADARMGRRLGHRRRNNMDEDSDIQPVEPPTTTTTTTTTSPRTTTSTTMSTTTTTTTRPPPPPTFPPLQVFDIFDDVQGGFANLGRDCNELTAEFLEQGCLDGKESLKCKRVVAKLNKKDCANEPCAGYGQPANRMCKDNCMGGAQVANGICNAGQVCCLPPPATTTPVPTPVPTTKKPDGNCQFRCTPSFHCEVAAPSGGTCPFILDVCCLKKRDPFEHIDPPCPFACSSPFECDDIDFKYSCPLGGLNVCCRSRRTHVFVSSDFGGNQQGDLDLGIGQSKSGASSLFPSSLSANNCPHSCTASVACEVADPAFRCDPYGYNVCCKTPKSIYSFYDAFNSFGDIQPL